MRAPRLRPEIDVNIAHGESADAFGRLRVSNSLTLLDAQLHYGENTFLWESVATGGGTLTYSHPRSSITLAGNGGTVKRCTKFCARYQPGKSQGFKQSFVLGAPPGVDSGKRIGYNSYAPRPLTVPSVRLGERVRWSERSHGGPRALERHARDAGVDPERPA